MEGDGRRRRRRRRRDIRGWRETRLEGKGAMEKIEKEIVNWLSVFFYFIDFFCDSPKNPLAIKEEKRREK